jgi:hypothetical protein
LPAFLLLEAMERLCLGEGLLVVDLGETRRLGLGSKKRRQDVGATGADSDRERRS